MRNQKLTALIYPNREKAEHDKLNPEALEKIMKGHQKNLNKHSPAFMKIAAIEVREKEFEKTPKQSIKRYLYQGI